MNKATLKVMLITLLLGGCATSPHVSQDMFLVEQGFEALSSSNYLEAEGYLQAALDISPNNPYTLLNLGVVFQDTGRTKEAIGMYQKVLELNPQVTAIKSNREEYSGKKIVEIARENLKSLGISDFIYSKVSDVVQYKDPLQMAGYSAAGHSSILGTEENQDTVDIASAGGPSGIGASSGGPGGDTAGGGVSGGTGSGGDSASGSSGGDPGGNSGSGSGNGNGNGNGNSGANGNGNGNGNAGANGNGGGNT